MRPIKHFMNLHPRKDVWYRTVPWPGPHFNFDTPRPPIVSLTPLKEKRKEKKGGRVSQTSKSKFFENIFNTKISPVFVQSRKQMQTGETAFSVEGAP